MTDGEPPRKEPADGRWWVATVAVLVAGSVLAAVLAGSFSMSAHDTAVLLGWSAGGAAVAGVLAAVLLTIWRRARTATQVVVVALAPIVGIALGVIGAAQAMFFSRHDLRSLAVILTGAGTVALIAAMALGRRFSVASRSVANLARGLDGTGPAPVSLDAAPGELAALAHELALTSKRLAAARAQADALERGRRQLVAWVSHDLRTPLSGMRAMVEAMQDGVVADEVTVARYHRTLLAEIQRLSALVDDLFVLATIESGAVDLRLEPVSVDELVGEAIAGAAAKAGAKGVELEAAPSDAPLIVELSSAEMSRVVHNLLDNAIRHTPAGSRVRVETGFSPDGTRARVAVVDGCGGITPDDLDRVFDLAFRGDAARSADTGGGGLGLAVARGLVQAHQGGLTVVNVGGGCRFTIDLPLRRPEPA